MILGYHLNMSLCCKQEQTWFFLCQSAYNFIIFLKKLESQHVFNLLFYSTQDRLPSAVAPIVNWALLHQSLVKNKSPTDVPTGNLMKEFFQLRFLFPNNSSLYEINKNYRDMHDIPFWPCVTRVSLTSNTTL